MLTDRDCRNAKPKAELYELRDKAIGELEPRLNLRLRVRPSGRKTWVATYRDGKLEPVVAKDGTPVLQPSGEPKRERRRGRVTLGDYPEVSLAEARDKAAARRQKIIAGEGPRRPKEIAGATLAAIVDLYVAERSPGWKPSTRATYLSAIGTFKAWADRERIRLAEDLDADKLARLRAHLVTLPRRTKAKGGSRKDVVSTGDRRSASAINCDLRAVKTMLQALRVAGRLPAITSSDTIRENLGAVEADVAKPKPLKPAAIAKLLAACERHDAETFAKTRGGDTGAPRFEPIGPLAALMLLSGMRLGEALALEWSDVDLEEGELLVRAGKTGRERAVDLGVTPALAKLLAAMRLASGGKGRLFPAHTQVTVGDARRRLIAEYGAPAFLWSTRNSRPGERSAPTLRSTCGCYLACAPAIFGGASVYMSAAHLGHSVQVAEKHYLGTLKRIPKEATTIEAAMGIEDAIAVVPAHRKRGAR